MGLKFTFVLGGLCMSVMIICQAMPALKTQRELQNIEYTGSLMDKMASRNGVLTILLIGSLFGGVSQAVLGVASCDFIARCSTEKTKGFYYGYYFAWYMASNIPGNYIGSILIKETSGPQFFTIMSIICILGTMLFLLLTVPKERRNIINDDHYVNTVE